MLNALRALAVALGVGSTLAGAQQLQRLENGHANLVTVMTSNTSLMERVGLATRKIVRMRPSEDCQRPERFDLVRAVACRRELQEHYDDLSTFLNIDPWGYVSVAGDKFVTRTGREYEPLKSARDAVDSHVKMVFRLQSRLVPISNAVRAQYPERCEIKEIQLAALRVQADKLTKAIQVGDLYEARRAQHSGRRLFDQASLVRSACVDLTGIYADMLLVWQDMQSALGKESAEGIFARGCSSITSQNLARQLCSSSPNEASVYSVHLALSDQLK